MVGALRRNIRARDDKLQIGRQMSCPGAVRAGTYALSLGGIHGYDSIIVFEEAVVVPPSDEMTGVPFFAPGDHAQQFPVP
jgi:hypothetical protein